MKFFLVGYDCYDGYHGSSFQYVAAIRAENAEQAVENFLRLRPETLSRDKLTAESLEVLEPDGTPL